MALSFFTQRDIENIDATNIPIDFKNYFDGLSVERKIEIIDSRPDLAAGLNYSAKNEFIKVEIIDEYDDEDFQTDSINEEDFNEEHVNSYAIGKSIYNDKDISELMASDVNPFEALSIDDKEVKCKIHRKKFDIVDLKYKSMRPTYGVRLKWCNDCKRFYIDNSKVEYVKEKLQDRGITTQIYSVKDVNIYILGNTPSQNFSIDQCIYIPEIWIEEKSDCPIHNEVMEIVPYKIKYKDREVNFSGYFCEKCNKTILKRSSANRLLDKCAEEGIPQIETSKLVRVLPKRKIVKKEVKVDFFISDGKKYKYDYSRLDDYVSIGKADTVVISDTIYCDIDAHDTEEVKTLFKIDEKKHGNKNYLCLMGYCSQCQKYYIEESDFNVIYSVGRAEFAVLNNLEESEYLISSGDVFEKEKKHLGELEKNLDQQITNIMSKSDYVPPYATGIDYEDITDLQLKKQRSKEKYEGQIQKWQSHMPKPYEYRVDIIFDNEKETYYLGPTDIIIDNRYKVISFNSDFGRELVNYRTVNIKKDGKKYDIKLSRQFDIYDTRLFGYSNLRTDEDIVFRSGITDPFLIKVLNMRKKQHNLVDIISTIQENQNVIVDVTSDMNIVVQGCAGSGKTMVMLHRLSALKYRDDGFELENTLILTPNERFNLHIAGLADGLQIGNINKKSIEQFYIDTLLEYSNDIFVTNKIVSENNVNQDLVDYIYSDDFYNILNAKYELEIKERYEFLRHFEEIANILDDYSKVNYGNDSEYVNALRNKIDYLLSKVNTVRNDAEKASENLSILIERKKYIEDTIPEKEEQFKNIFDEIYPKVNSKVKKHLNDELAVIESTKEQIVNIEKDIEKLENQFLVIGKRTKIDIYEKELSKANKRLKRLESKYDEDIRAFDYPQDEGSVFDKYGRLRVIANIEPTIQSEISYFEEKNKELENLRLEYSTIDLEIEEANKLCASFDNNSYMGDIFNQLTGLRTLVDKYTIRNTYRRIFNNALSGYLDEHKIKVPESMHRYDLYVQLWFCIKYFNKTVGTNKLICIDEGQDLAFNEYRLIKELNPNVTFNIYGDTNQLLKPGRGISDWTKLMNLFDMKKYVLNENYRNTNQITRFCNDSFNMDVLQTGVDGLGVKQIQRDELERNISELKFNGERIALLLPRSERRNKFLNMEIIPDEVVEHIDDVIDNDKLVIMYVDEVKGIEFDKVYVVSKNMSWNEKYIAYTRALSELIVVENE